MPDPVPCRPHDEPIPGYRLLQRLGAGGFGEVWKVEAPGGVLKALKIVHALLTDLGPMQPNTHQELKGLQRVKSVRHPYILSLDRYDLIDGRLLIVMELADGTLWDRYQSFRVEGLPGVPRAELLARLEEAAEALDLMNRGYQLQHLDVKPHNLFLLCDHLKVGDFGLVKDLEGMRCQMTGGLSAFYSAPEMFEGKVSPYCDQYSLAIVFQELLTGKRPFPGASPRQLMLQHLQTPPDLSALPPGDRDILARALAKKPEDRFATCADLIAALKGTAPAAKSNPGTDGLRRTLADAASDRMTQVTQRLQRGPGKPATTNPAGALVPAVVIGLGGVGGAALQALRQAMLSSHGSAGLLPHLRLLQVDIDGKAERVEAEAFLHTPLSRMSNYRKRKPGRPPLDAWLPLSALRHLRSEQETAEGQRFLGRLAFVDHYPAIVRRLRAELKACANPIALMSTTKRTGLQFRTDRPRVYLVAGLAGGTGSGMFLDMAYVARQLLRELGPEEPEVVGLLFLPEVEEDASPRSLANTCAALRELAHYSDARTLFTAWYNENEEGIADPAPPLQRCVLLPSAPRGPALAGNLLYLDLATPLGAAADRARAELPLPEAGGLLCHSAGAYRLTVPRRPLIQRVSRTLCARLWQGKASMQASAPLRAVEHWARAGLAPEELAGRLHAACERTLGGVPAVVFDRIAGKLLEGGPDALRRRPDSALKALTHLERWVGQPGAAAELGMLAEVMDEVIPSLKPALLEKLANLQWVALGELLFRPAGAEAAFAQELAAVCDALLQQQEAMRQECARQEVELRGKILAAVERLQRGAWRSWSRGRTARELLHALHLYPTTRYRSLVYQRVALLYQALQKAVRRPPADFTCCRARLGQFLRQFQDALGTGPDADGPVLGRLLLPAGCRNLAQAAAELLMRLPAEASAELQQRAYDLIGTHLQARGHVCTLAPDGVRKLMGQVYQQAQACAEAHLGWGDAAELYLRSVGGEAAVVEDLAGAFAASLPSWSPAGAAEICLLAVPAGAAGSRLAELAREALPGAAIRESAHLDEILLYREETAVRVAALPHLGSAGHRAYRKLDDGVERTCHSRLDVVQWLPCSELQARESDVESSLRSAEGAQ